MDSLVRQKAFAWAKYYENIRGQIVIDRRHYTTIKEMEDRVPTHIKDEIVAMGAELRKKWECPICIEMIESENIAITNCGHFFCKGCLDTYKSTNVDCKCPVCRRKISG